ncbi:MAG TPA: IS1380 family transposase, partial [Candidatus Binatia bacterium]|nr:IS1380 family transposase [Candidatus Binatia bacterium]
HPITVWAGVILLRLYFEWVGLRQVLSESLVDFVKRSNNQIRAVDVMLSWFYGLALGAERFEHFTRYRRDRLLGELLGVERFCSPDTLRRLFWRFNYRQVTEVSERLMRFSLSGMRPILMGHTLDLDSTVLCRYGEQEGSLRGYNPRKPGRPSHHPLVAFLAEGRRLLWAVLRSGNSGSANGCVEFLRQALTVLPAGHRIGLIRADAGFFEKRLLEYLESQRLPYIMVARLTAVVRKLVIHQTPFTAWRVVARGVEVADLEVSLPNWKGVKRRFVLLRQEIFERPQARGRRLIDCPGYTYRVMVTSLPYAAEVVSRMYVGRADSENRIKELKEDLSLDTFCLKSFDATDASFRMGCVLYNLLTQFRETVLPRSWFERRLRAVRDFVFLVGADLISQGRRVQIRFAMPEPDRPEFLRRLTTMSEGLPIAAQLEWGLTAQAPTHPDKIITPMPLISPHSTVDQSP